MKAQALMLLLLVFGCVGCDDDKSAEAKDETTEDGDDSKKKKKEKKAKGPEVQSCTLASGCSEYRTEQFQETAKTVEDTCKQGGGKYAQAPCSRDNALGTCKRNVGSATESMLVIYKIGKLTAELAEQSCAGGEWEAAK